MQVLLLHFSYKAFIPTIFLASNQLVIFGISFILLPLKCSINFSLNLLRTGLLYLLDITMTNSVMPVHYVVCHLDLN